jgi:hypothetical protein
MTNLLHGCSPKGLLVKVGYHDSLKLTPAGLRVLKPSGAELSDETLGLALLVLRERGVIAEVRNERGEFVLLDA